MDQIFGTDLLSCDSEDACKDRPGSSCTTHQGRLYCACPITFPYSPIHNACIRDSRKSLPPLLNPLKDADTHDYFFSSAVKCESDSDCKKLPYQHVCTPIYEAEGSTHSEEKRCICLVEKYVCSI